MGLDLRTAAPTLWLLAIAAAAPAYGASACPTAAPVVSIPATSTVSGINDTFTGPAFSINGAIDGDGIVFKPQASGGSIAVTSNAPVSSGAGSGVAGITFDGDFGALCYDSAAGANVTGDDVGLDVEDVGDGSILLSFAHTITAGSNGITIDHGDNNLNTGGNGAVTVKSNGAITTGATGIEINKLAGGAIDVETTAGILSHHGADTVGISIDQGNFNNGDGGNGNIVARVGGAIDVSEEAVSIGKLGDGNIRVSTTAKITANIGVEVQRLDPLALDDSTGDIDVDTGADITAADVAIAIGHDGRHGDVNISTKAGTTLSATSGTGKGGVPILPGTGIYVERLVPDGVGTGNITIDNAANIKADRLGIYADICACTDGRIDIESTGDISAGVVGIYAATDHDATVRVTNGTISSPFSTPNAGVLIFGDHVTFELGPNAQIITHTDPNVVAPGGLAINSLHGADVTIAGKIRSTYAPAIDMTADSAAHTLTLDPGYAIEGDVLGGAGTDTLILGGAGTGSFDLGGLGTQYQSFDALKTLAGAVWNISGSATVGTADIGSGTVYHVAIDGKGKSSRLTVTGKAAVAAGAAVEVDPLPGSIGKTTTYTILSAAGGVTGNFGQLTTRSPYFDASLSADSHNIFLTLGLSAAGFGNGYLSVATGFIFDSHLLRDAVLDRLLTGRDTPSGTGATGFAADAPDPTAKSGAAAWAQSYGGIAHIDGGTGAASLNDAAGGLLVGGDGMLGDARVGMLLGYGLTGFSDPAGSLSGTSRDYSYGFYGGTDWDAFYTSFGATITGHDIEATRSAGGASFAAHYGALTTQAFGEAGRPFDLGGTTITPFAGIVAVNNATSAFTETGGARIGGSSTNALLTTLGLRLEHQFVLGDDMLVTLSGSAAWQHAFGGTASALSTAPGAGILAISGAPLPADALLAKFGAHVDISDDLAFGVDYSGIFTGRSGTHALTATLTGKL